MEKVAEKVSDIVVREKRKHAEERRQVHRHLVNVDSQVVEPSVCAVINGRMTDLGLGGCYVDSMTTFPVGTTVIVRLMREDLTFEAQARIVFSKQGLGMGLAFMEMQPADREFLKHWVEELSGNGSATRQTNPVNPLNPSSVTPTSPLQQLITLLMRKGTLAQSEYELLLREIEKSQVEK